MKRIALIVGALLGLILLSALALPFVIDPNTFRPMLEARLGEALGRAVKLGELNLSMKLIKITGGRFSLGNTAGHAKPLVLEDVNLEVRDFSPAAAFPFTFATKVSGGGAIKLDGKFGPLDAKDVAASSLTANLDID